MYAESEITSISGLGKKKYISFSRKSNILLVLSIFLLVFLLVLSLKNTQGLNTATLDETSDISIMNSVSNTKKAVDTDGDGISDAIEDNIGTDKLDKYGDRDGDGLYDYEEYLDIYGTPDDATDVPRYKYYDSTTHGNVLDIYHHFNRSSNMAGYIRDRSYIYRNRGLNNYLMWNVTFSNEGAGGSYNSETNYRNCILFNVTFSGRFAGGSSDSSSVTYDRNTFYRTTFSGRYAGGSLSGSVSYINNVFNDVNFSGLYAGGSATGNVLYENNSLTNVRYFRGTSADGNSGISTTGQTTFTNNTFNRVQYAQLSSGRRYFNIVVNVNTIIDDSYDSDDDGLGDIYEFLISRTDPENNDTDSDTLNDKWEVTYNGASGVNPLSSAYISDLRTDQDGDNLDLEREEDLGTNPNNADTDGRWLN